MIEMLQKVQKVFQDAANFDKLFLRFKSDEVIAPSAAQAKIARKRLESTNKFSLTNCHYQIFGIKAKKKTSFHKILNSKNIV